MEARLRLPHSLSQPRPMRRPHDTGSEEPRRDRSQAKEQPGPSRRETASSSVAAVERRGSTTLVPVRGRAGALLRARLTIDPVRH
jgi:hypothetical protein